MGFERDYAGDEDAKGRSEVEGWGWEKHPYNERSLVTNAPDFPGYITA